MTKILVFLHCPTHNHAKFFIDQGDLMAAARPPESKLITVYEHHITEFKYVITIPNTTMFLACTAPRQGWYAPGKDPANKYVLHLFDAKDTNHIEKIAEYVFPGKIRINKIVALPSGLIYCSQYNHKENGEQTDLLLKLDSKTKKLVAEKIPTLYGKLFSLDRYLAHTSDDNNQGSIKVNLSADEYDFFEGASPAQPFVTKAYWKEHLNIEDIESKSQYKILNPAPIPNECTLHEFDEQLFPSIHIRYATLTGDGSLAVIDDAGTMTIYEQEEKGFKSTGVAHQLDFIKTLGTIACMPLSKDSLFIYGASPGYKEPRYKWNSARSEPGYIKPNDIEEMYIYNINSRTITPVIPKATEKFYLYIDNVTLTPDNKILYSCQGGYDEQKIIGINIETGEVTSTILPHEKPGDRAIAILGMTNQGFLIIANAGKISLRHTPYSLTKKVSAETEIKHTRHGLFPAAPMPVPPADIIAENIAAMSAHKP